MRNAAGESNVIVLDEHSVRKVETMVLPAAAAHGVFIDDAQPRGRFPRIENSRSRSRNCLNKFASERCYPAHPLKKVEYHPLAGEQHPSVVANHSHRLSRTQSHSIKNLRMRGDFIMRSD